MNRYAGGRKAFDQPQNILKFVLLAGVVSTTVSATFGLASLYVGGLVHGNGHVIWLTWWVGDLVSDVVYASLLLIWSAPPYPRWKPARIPETVLLAGAVFLVGQAVFGGWLMPRQNYPIGYLTILPLLWAAWRFGLHGASAAALMTSVIAIMGTLHGFGPFATQQPRAALHLLQTFLGYRELDRPRAGLGGYPTESGPPPSQHGA